MVQRTVLKVDVSCLKCKKKLLKAVSALQGVDKVEVDAAKGTLAVTGDADPYDIIVRTRKAGNRCAEVVSVGPPPKPQEKKPEEKKPEPKKPEAGIHFHPSHSCPVCSHTAIVQVDRYPEPMVCSIL